jgi:Tfp pilus assembly protein PilO
MKKLLLNLDLIFLLVVALSYSGSFTEHTKKVSMLTSQQQSALEKEKKLKVQVEIALKFKENLEASKKRVEYVTEQIKTVQQQLPTVVADTEVLDFLAQNADSLNIRDLAQKALQEELIDFYYSKKFEFNAQGTFLQFLVFLEKLADAERIYNIQKMSLRRGSGKQKGRFEMVDFKAVIESYRYNPGYKLSLQEPNSKTDPRRGRRRMMP